MYKNKIKLKKQEPQILYQHINNSDDEHIIYSISTSLISLVIYESEIKYNLLKWSVVCYQGYQIKKRKLKKCQQFVKISDVCVYWRKYTLE